MRISEIRLINYRQYREASLVFSEHDPHDLHLVVGDNGCGKTNLLNAINWCLYDDEPHLNLDSQQLSRCNLGAVEDAEVGGEVLVEVELTAKTATDEAIRFRRREVYAISDEDDPHQGKIRRPSLVSARLQVIRSKETHDAEILENDEAAAQVERFVPSAIREFFFFDSERLDRYFREAVAQNTRHAIHELSGVALLERVEGRLAATEKDLRKESSKHSPALETTQQALEQAESSQADLHKRLQECDDQIEAAKNKIDEYNKALSGLEQAADLEEQRKRIGSDIAATESSRQLRAGERYTKLLQGWTLRGFREAADGLIAEIDAMRGKKVLPPPVGVSVLEDGLAHDECQICGQELTEKARKRLSALLEQLGVNTDTAEALLRAEAYLRAVLAEAAASAEAVKGATAELRGLEAYLKRLHEELAAVDEALSGFDTDKIAEMSESRARYERLYEAEMEKRGALKAQKAVADAEVERARKAYEAALAGTEQAAGLRRELEFCEKALTILRGAMQELIGAARQKVEELTTARFLSLIWKKHTFSGVRINDQHDLSLIHVKGHSCLGSVSAAERQLLALSFTLALHEVSGFQAPILIDTPVARVTGQNRLNFASVLTTLSEQKQVVLIFTPDEYSDEVRAIVNPVAATRQRIRLNDSETETEVVSLTSAK